MKYRMLALLLAFALLAGLCACTAKPGADINSKLEALQSAQEPSQKQDDPAPAPAEPEPQKEQNPRTERPAKVETPPGTPEITPEPGPAPISLCLLGGYAYDYLTERESSVYVTWPEVILSPDGDAARFPALAGTLAERMEFLASEHEEHFQELMENARQTQGAELYWRTEALVRRADEGMLSILLETNAYAGGVHPDYWFRSVNFDTESGEQIPLSDVVTDMFALPGVLETLLKEAYPNVEFFDLRKNLEEAVSGGGVVWTADPAGVTFWFSPYALSSFADGEQVVTATFADYPELFTEPVTRTPRRSAMQLTTCERVPTAHGLLSVSAPENEYGAIERYTVALGADQLTKELWSYQLSPYLCTLETGTQMLLVIATSDNDYTDMTLLSVSDGLRETDGMVPTDLRSREISAEPSRWAMDLLTDPERFYADTRIQLLGTMNASSAYRVTAGGFVPLQSAMEVEGRREITSKMDLTLPLLPDMTETQLPAGTKLVPAATDGGTYMDLETADGRRFRLELEKPEGEWEYSVKSTGLPVTEVFDDILYAG